MKYAEVAEKQSERAEHRLVLTLQSLGMLLSRFGDETLPDVSQLRDLRRSVEDHYRATIEGFIDASSRDQRTLVESVKAYHHLAGLFFVGGPLEESVKAHARAIDLCNQVIREHPSHVSYRILSGNSHNILALMLHAVGRWVEATQHLQQAQSAYLAAVALDAGDAEGLRRLRWFLAVCPESRFQDPDRILALTDELKEFERTRETPWPWDPTRSPHWLLTGIALYRKGRFESAIDVLEEPLYTADREQASLYGAGDEALGRFVLAMAYHRVDKRTSALECFRAAVKIMDTNCPSSAELMIFRAEATALLGQCYDLVRPGLNRAVNPAH